MPVTRWYRSKVFTQAYKGISCNDPHVGKGWDLFWSDWREGAVFS
jgi:hypothetical protein